MANRYSVDLFRPDIIPVPLRADFTAHVHIPLDMTEREARKIAAVVMAYAQGTEAQRAMTVKQGMVHDGPVLEEDAPKLSHRISGEDE